jgi:hypothetical protein
MLCNKGMHSKTGGMKNGNYTNRDIFLDGSCGGHDSFGLDNLAAASTWDSER